MFLFIALAGAGGAACRFLISTWIQIKWAKVNLYATTIINMIGSFLLGICFGLHMLYPSDNQWYTIVATGFFGAFTTFSTFSYEAVSIYLKFPKKGVLFIVANICIATFFSSLAILILT